MKAGELTSEHLGKELAVKRSTAPWAYGNYAAASGTLIGVSHSAGVIHEKAIGEAEGTLSLGGPNQTVLHFLEGSSMVTTPDAQVELLT